MDKYHIILASQSPRRRELLSGLDIDFEVRVLPDIEENYPDDLPTPEIPVYIATEKAAAYKDLMSDHDLIITADTVVVLGDEVLGKPVSLDDAKRMLRELSGHTHQVITGVCLMTRQRQRSFAVTTDVTFKQLTEEEITYYVEKYQPLDKAGAYGAQDSDRQFPIIKNIIGSYDNVIGFPVKEIKESIEELISSCGS